MGNVSKKDKVDSRTGISRNEKKAIRESWRAFRENNPGYSYLLFTGLFMKNPLYLNLFVVFRGKSLLALQDNPKFRAHASAVGYQFSAMVDSLDDPDVLVELIRKNAVNHLTRKGVQAVHFESLCKVTMEIMAEKVPSKMNYEAVCGWDKLFEVMIWISKNVFQSAVDPTTNVSTSSTVTEHPPLDSADSRIKDNILGGPSKTPEDVLASSYLKDEIGGVEASDPPRNTTSDITAKPVTQPKIPESTKEKRTTPKKD